MTIADTGNQVIGETGKNITIQWMISLEKESSIRQIEVYFQSLSKNRLKIAFWNSQIDSLEDAEKQFENRLILIKADHRFILKVTNVQFEDSGNYSIEVIMKNPLEVGKSSITVNIHGMFFSFH